MGYIGIWESQQVAYTMELRLLVLFSVYFSLSPMLHESRRVCLPAAQVVHSYY